MNYKATDHQSHLRFPGAHARPPRRDVLSGADSRRGRHALSPLAEQLADHRLLVGRFHCGIHRMHSEFGPFDQTEARRHGYDSTVKRRRPLARSKGRSPARCVTADLARRRAVASASEALRAAGSWSLGCGAHTWRNVTGWTIERMSSCCVGIGMWREPRSSRRPRQRIRFNLTLLIRLVSFALDTAAPS